MTDLRELAKRIYLETLQATEPDRLIRDRILLINDHLIFDENKVDLDRFDEVVLIGIGKASLKMGAAVEGILGDRISRGVLVTDRRSNTRVRSEVLVAGHPLPDAQSLAAGQKISQVLSACNARSLIVFLISGGGSALVELPSSPAISLEDLRLTNAVLTRCGASIREINIVRKSFSRIKGGGLGLVAGDSTKVGLFLSDVNSGDIRSIASNPLLPEEISEADLLEVMDRFDLRSKLPKSVLSAITEYGFAGRKVPKSNLTTLMLADNSSALAAAAAYAKSLDFEVKVVSDFVEGEYQTIAEDLIDRLLHLKAEFRGQGVCIVSGGEVACEVRGGGIGGRNQEFVLYSAARLASLGVEDTAVLSCGTDGIDGNSSAAGAVLDAKSVTEAARQGLDASTFISDNDSHSFFKSTGGLVITGPSGNNIRDLRLFVAG